LETEDLETVEDPESVEDGNPEKETVVDPEIEGSEFDLGPVAVAIGVGGLFSSCKGEV